MRLTPTGLRISHRVLCSEWEEVGPHCYNHLKERCFNWIFFNGSNSIKA